VLFKAKLTRVGLLLAEVTCNVDKQGLIVVNFLWDTLSLQPLPILSEVCNFAAFTLKFSTSHSSAKFYVEGEQGIYPVTGFTP